MTLSVKDDDLIAVLIEGIPCLLDAATSVLLSAANLFMVLELWLWYLGIMPLLEGIPTSNSALICATFSPATDHSVKKHLHPIVV